MTRLLFCGLFVLLSPLFVACGGEKQEAANRTDLSYRQSALSGEDSLTIYQGDLPNVVRTHLLSEPNSLHPILQGGINRTLVLQYTFQSLQTQDIATGELLPMVARLLKVSADGNQLTYELLADATWPDGTPITAQDVIFSAKINGCPHVRNVNVKPLLKYLADVRLDPDNPRRFKVMMREFFMSNEYFGVYFYLLDPRRFDPDGVVADYSLAELLDPESQANQQEAVQAWGESLSSPTTGQEMSYLQGGSGPYQVAEWTQGERIRLAPTPDYWGADRPERFHQQGPEEIVFTFVRDPQSITYQLKQQALDVSTAISTESYDALQASDLMKQHFDLHAIPGQSLALLVLNNRPVAANRPRVFDETDARRAVSYALDLDGMLQDVLNNYAQRSTSPVSPDNPHYVPPPAMPHAPDSARLLLTQLGWRDSDQDGIRDRMIEGERVPLRFELLFPPTGAVLQQMADRIRRELADVGIDCQLKPKDQRDYIQDLLQGNYDVALFSFGKTSFPYDFHQLFHSDNYPDGFNLFGYENPTVDSLIDRMRITRDAEQRRAMAAEIQRRIYRDQPGVFLYFTTKKVAVHKRFNHGGPYLNNPYVLLNELRVVRPDEEAAQ